MPDTPTVDDLADGLRRRIALYRAYLISDPKGPAMVYAYMREIRKAEAELNRIEQRLNI
jgi:hypothetical protein